MFDSLKKRLKESVKTLTRKVSRPAPEKKPVRKPKAKRPKEKPAKRPEKIQKPPGKPREERPEIRVREIPKPEEIPEAPKRGLFRRIREKVTDKALSEQDIDLLFQESEPELLQANVALEVIDFLRDNLKKRLAGKQVKRSRAGESIKKAFEQGLLETVDQGRTDLIKLARKKKPLTCVFLGFNGSGKTTTISKVARYLQNKGLKPLLAAGDTFRAAAQEQLEHHGEKLKIKVIKHQYGADSAAVIYDAVRHAESKGYDFVLADTAGRTHVDKNLADELKKVCRVNKPDLKILVVDSLTGNDAVEQARDFNEMVGVDAVVMTKVDVNKKGGSILSVCYAIKKPILFIGMGQGYNDLESFSPAKFVKQVLE